MKIGEHTPVLDHPSLGHTPRLSADPSQEGTGKATPLEHTPVFDHSSQEGRGTRGGDFFSLDNFNFQFSPFTLL